MKRINIAELLSNCPSGMELDCTMFEGVFLEKVDKNVEYPIAIKVGKTDVKHLTKEGCWNKYSNAKCVIFPKGKTTWEGFVPPCQFKDGDIVTSKDRGLLVACIYKERKDNVSFNHHIALYKGSLGVLVHERIALTDDELRFATEEEKAKLFKAIKYKGYKWNEEIKTLEKFIKSKEDTNDKVVMAGIYFDREYYADEVELHLGNYEIKVRDGKTYAVRKQLEYPKTYKECCDVLGCKADDFFTDFTYNGCGVEISNYEDKLDDLLQNFRKLRYCRDSYWKIAGEQMGLSKPWKPDWTDSEFKYCIKIIGNTLECVSEMNIQCILAFPTAEMRDTFFKNFGHLIEICKELL